MAIRVGSKLALINLERAGVLPPEHIEPQLEAMAVKLYRDPMWQSVPQMNQWRGLIIADGVICETNEHKGEIKWR